MCTRGRCPPAITTTIRMHITRFMMRSKASLLVQCLLTRNSHRFQHTVPMQMVSGIQPTGNIHIGNYFGAIKEWVDFQERPSFPSTALPPVFQIVDMHSITTCLDASKLNDNIYEVAAVLLGCGLDPTKCILFKQSSVPLNGYLCWVLASISTMAQLARFPQFKEKSAEFKEPPLGLYLYPVLQVADILLYKGTHVPVGDDQLAHINLAKQMANKFNSAFKNDLFPIPKEILSKAGRVKSLRTPHKKMSKSEVSAKSRIELTDSSDDVALKIRKSITDMTSQVTFDPINRPGVSNLIEIYSIVSGLNPEQVCKHFEGKDTSQFKIELGDILVEYLRPIRTRIVDLSNDRHYLETVLMEGASRALKIAEETYLQVQKTIGSGMANFGVK